MSKQAVFNPAMPILYSGSPTWAYAVDDDNWLIIDPLGSSRSPQWVSCYQITMPVPNTEDVLPETAA